MQKIFLICCSLVLFLTGCTDARYDSDIVLSSAPEDEASMVVSEEISLVGEDGTGTVQNDDSADNLETIVVYVCGAVISPGVYELSSGCRVNDAVVMAGGFTEDADENFVNLAARIEDGAKLFIPTKDEVEKGIAVDNQGNTGISATESGGLININTATVEELRTIPGIGEKVASKIVDYRQKNGRFEKKEDIMKVSGIKEKLFSKIQEYITV